MNSLLERIQAKKQALAIKNAERPTKLSSAQNQIRILPNWAGDADGPFFQDFGQHFIKNAAGQNQATYICTANTSGEPCDVCAALAAAASQLHPDDEVGAKTIHEARGSSRILVNAIYRNGTHPNAAKEPVLLELPPTVLEDILGIAENYLSQHGLNIFDLEKGYDLTVTKSGAGRDTRYSVVCSPVPSVVDPSALNKCRNLEDYVKQASPAMLQKALVAVKQIFLQTPSGRALAPPTPAAPSAAPSLAAPALEAPSTTQRLAATAPVEMEEVPIPDAPLQVPSTPTASAAAAAETELDELEELLRDPTLKVA